MMKAMVKRSGFSLLEILFSLAILAIASLAITSVLLSARHAQNSITEAAAARALAAQQLERAIQGVNLASSSEVDRFWSNDFDESRPWTSGELRQGNRVFFYRVEARTVRYSGDALHPGEPVGSGSGATENGLKKLTVVLSWVKPGDESAPQRGKQSIVVSQLFNRVKR